MISEIALNQYILPAFQFQMPVSSFFHTSLAALFSTHFGQLLGVDPFYCAPYFSARCFYNNTIAILAGNITPLRHTIPGLHTTQCPHQMSGPLLTTVFMPNTALSPWLHLFLGEILSHSSISTCLSYMHLGNM